MITYTWKITGLRTKTENNNTGAVTQTYWQKIGTDLEGNTGTFSGATPFSTGSMPEGNVFVPFEQLTEAAVLKWVQDSIPEGGSYEQHINNAILKQLEAIAVPATETPMPWVVPEQEPPSV